MKKPHVSPRTYSSLFSVGYYPKLDADLARFMDELERRKYPEFWATKQEEKKALEIGRKHRAKVNKKTSPHIDHGIYEAVEKLLRGKKKLTKDAVFRRVVQMFAKGGHSLSVSTVRRAWQRGRPMRG